MKNINIYRCPQCSEGQIEKAGDVLIKCKVCGQEYQIINDIPRFVPVDNYSSNFGFQWNKYAKTQLDKYNGTTITKDRFFLVTRWNEKLEGDKILEVGSGAGRFTQVLLDTGADIYSVDYSSAVEANMKNNGPNNRLNLMQGDIYALPFDRESFEKVFCLGVLQHCPDTEKAFFSLVPFVKKGGELVVDFYEKSWKKYLFSYYWLRPITKRLPQKILYNLICKTTPWLLPFSTFLGNIPVVGMPLRKIFFLSNYNGVLPLDKQQQLEWSILDTFDRLGPTYDNPQSLKTVQLWFEKAGFKDIDVRKGPNGVIAKGVKS